MQSFRVLRYLENHSTNSLYSTRAAASFASGRFTFRFFTAPLALAFRDVLALTWAGSILMLKRIPLLAKVSIAPLVAGLVLLILLAWQAHALGEIEQDAVAINLAGSERMRLFKLVILTEQYTEHREPKVRALIDKEMTTFEAILHGLKHGDPQYDLKSVGDPELIAYLDKRGDEWNKTIKPLFQNVLAASASNETLRTLKDHVEAYVTRIDTLIALLQAYSDKKIDAQFHLLWMFLLANIVIGLGSVIYIHLIILKPIKMFAEMSRAIAAGDLSRAVPVLSEDEIGELASDFNEMSSRLKNHIEVLQERTVELEAQKALIETDRRTILGLKRFADNIIASLPAGLIVVNDTLKVRSVNRSFREMFRLKNGEDVSGRELGDILPLPDLRQQAQTVLASGMALRGIDVALGEKWLRLTITGIRLAEEEEEEEEEVLVAVEDITELKVQAAHIEQLAFYDPLTCLPNRSLLRDRVQQVLTHSTRHKNHGAILFIDLDNFKTLNDTRGHNIGDLLLIEVAKRLQDCVRSSDTVARLGGDEFVVVLEELNEDTQQAVAQARGIGEKVLATLNQPFNLQGFEHYNSASIGISLFRDNEIGMDDLLRHADTAMYQAKTSGRNTLRFFDPDMQASLEARATLEADLRHALSQQQFNLFYQIQVNAANHPSGAEALLRWLHPERGLVSPLQFIPLAEDTGLILPIGQWVLETACVQIKAWEASPLGCALQLAVNVSARQFHQPGFVEQVREVLIKTGAAPNRLKLELTESVVLENINDTIAKMHELKQIGVRFSMDDFGTGYSSLSYLTQLPFDQLKIDRSFVHNIGIKPTDAVIVQTIIGMGNSLGMEVVAEGVENEEQRDFLERNGCHVYQGYLFSKPMPIKEFEVLIRMPN
ncbi:MAG: PAS/PAC sensor-containing diguanylate cyclase/phosphodiesterase [Rhodocyclaceae bacterium]|nr:MAG: PAS/PAC sensor-containing diguanylate cyclase/phosphodiesterase [Rhodocyclaceae bacterium]